MISADKQLKAVPKLSTAKIQIKQSVSRLMKGFGEMEIMEHKII